MKNRNRTNLRNYNHLVVVVVVFLFFLFVCLFAYLLSNLYAHRINQSIIIIILIYFSIHCKTSAKKNTAKFISTLLLLSFLLICLRVNGVRCVLLKCNKEWILCIVNGNGNESQLTHLNAHASIQCGISHDICVNSYLCSWIFSHFFYVLTNELQA